MATGTVQNVVVCVPRSQTATTSVSPCSTLGGVKSLFCHPASMTHASVEPEVRRSVGIGDSLIRLSAGLEDVRDLIDDLDQALERTAKVQPEECVA